MTLLLLVECLPARSVTSCLRNARATKRGKTKTRTGKAVEQERESVSASGREQRG